MIRKTYLLRNITLVAAMSLISAVLYAEGTPSTSKPVKNSDPPKTLTQSPDDKTKKSEADYRKWVEQEEERSGHVGASFFEKHDNKQ